MAKADPQESSAASASAGAEAPSPFVIDELAMALSSDIMLPMIEVPRPSGPGSSDPFGIMPPMLFVGYDHPLTVLDQFFGGGQSGGRTTFMDAYEGGLFRDLSIATSSDLKFVTLRPTMSAYAPPSPQEQAISRMFTKGIMAIGAMLTPGPQDDILLSSGALGSGGGVTRFCHGTTQAGADSILGGLRPLSTATGQHAAGSFFAHEASAINALEAASHWPVVQGKVASTGVSVVEITVPNSTLNALRAQGLIRVRPVPGMGPSFPLETVFSPGALDTLNSSAAFRVVTPNF